MNLNPAQSKIELQLKSLEELKIPKVRTNLLIRVLIVLLPDHLNEKQLRMELNFPFKEYNNANLSCPRYPNKYNTL